MNKYAELKKKHSEENNTLPLKAAFGDEQFEKMMKEWGLTTSKENLMKIRSLGCGAFCLASDVYLFEEMRKRHDKEILELIKTDEGLKEIFEKEGYQIGNEVEEKGSETYVKTLFFGNIMLEMEYKIIKYN